MRISATYRALNSQLHAERADYGAGQGTSQWYQTIVGLAQSMRAKTILDYGCGKGALGRALAHMLVQNYDPAIEGLDGEPSPADLVVSLDVLEHVEPECLDEVLDHIQRLATKGVFLTVATRPAKKTLADGRNAHLIQNNYEWWLPKLLSRWEMRNFAGQEGEFCFIGMTKAKAMKEAA